MLDGGMAQFQAEMLARPRPPRRAGTRRSGEIDNSSAPGAANLARRIKAFWAAAGFDITVEVIHAGGPREAPVYGVRSSLICGRPPAMGGRDAGTYLAGGVGILFELEWDTEEYRGHEYTILSEDDEHSN
jgi:hypothetical protein